MVYWGGKYILELTHPTENNQPDFLSFRLDYTNVLRHNMARRKARIDVLKVYHSFSRCIDNDLQSRFCNCSYSFLLLIYSQISPLLPLGSNIRPSYRYLIVTSSKYHDHRYQSQLFHSSVSQFVPRGRLLPSWTAKHAPDRQAHFGGRFVGLGPDRLLWW